MSDAPVEGELYAVVNADHPRLLTPLLITNEHTGQSPADAGSEPAVYQDRSWAVDQLELQRAVYENTGLRLVRLTVEDVTESAMSEVDDR